MQMASSCKRHNDGLREPRRAYTNWMENVGIALSFLVSSQHLQLLLFNSRPECLASSRALLAFRGMLTAMRAASSRSDSCGLKIVYHVPHFVPDPPQLSCLHSLLRLSIDECGLQLVWRTTSNTVRSAQLVKTPCPGLVSVHCVAPFCLATLAYTCSEVHRRSLASVTGYIE
jgi:hypothetical protein